MSNLNLEQDDAKVQHQQELELIERIKAGDMNAFGILVVRYQNRLIQFLYRKYGDNGLVEDVAQNVFVLAYRRIDTFQGKSRFYTWLCTIGIRQMINAISARARRPDFTYEHEMEEDALTSYADLREDQSHSVEDLLLAEEKKREIEALIAQIPEKLLTPLLMSVDDELSYAEIAERLNITIDSVRSRINRARSEFKKLLANSNISL